MAEYNDGNSSPSIGIPSPMTSLTFSFENASLARLSVTPKRLLLPSDSESDLNDSTSSVECESSSKPKDVKLGSISRQANRFRVSDLRRSCYKHLSSSPMLFNDVEKENLRAYAISSSEVVRKTEEKLDTKVYRRCALGERDMNRENNCNQLKLANLLRNDDFSNEDLCVQPLDSCPPECGCKVANNGKFKFAKPSGIAPRSKADSPLRLSSHQKSEGYHSGSSDYSGDDGFLEPLALDQLDESDVSSNFSSLIHGAIIQPGKSPHKSPISNSIGFRRCLSMNAVETPKQRTAFGPRSLLLHHNRNNFENSAESGVKRLEPPNDYFGSIQNKRRKPCTEALKCRNELCKRSNSSPSPGSGVHRPILHRSFSETEATIMRAVQKSSSEPDLIGDFSKSFSLPLIVGKHQDLRSISHKTLARLINDDYSHIIDSYTIVDCRYPYEFDGGHIRGAINIYTKEDLMKKFLPDKRPCASVLEDVSNKENCSKRDILIFHCEFSSERGPTLSRFLRKKDREYNRENYPALHYPEIYLLEGGYKAFFAECQDLCEPMKYKPMSDPNHENDLKHFRAKSRSWNGDNKSRLLARPGVKRQM